MANTSPAPEEDGPSLREIVAAEVRSLRGRYSISQARLGEVLGLSQPQVSARLRGAVPFTLDEVDTLARAFGVSPASLMGMGQNAREMTAPPITLFGKGGGAVNAWSRRPLTHLTLVPPPADQFSQVTRHIGRTGESQGRVTAWSKRPLLHAVSQ